jgi:hypothetical protein
MQVGAYVPGSTVDQLFALEHQGRRVYPGGASEARSALSGAVRQFATSRPGIQQLSSERLHYELTTRFREMKSDACKPGTSAVEIVIRSINRALNTWLLEDIAAADEVSLMMSNIFYYQYLMKISLLDRMNLSHFGTITNEGSSLRKL